MMMNSGGKNNLNKQLLHHQSRFIINQRRANLVGNYGPPLDLEIESIPDPEAQPSYETYQLARARKSPPAPRTTYGGGVSGSGKRKANSKLEDIVFEETEEIITEPEASFYNNPDEPEFYEDSSSDVNAEAYMLSSPGSSCSGGGGGRARRRGRKSIQEVRNGVGTSPPASCSGKQESSSSSRRTKMYQLDPQLYPHAAAARASYENRLRRKREAQQLVSDLEFYKTEYERLLEENAGLKEELHEIRFNTNASDWYKFFIAAGVCQTSSMEYANTFQEEKMKANMIGDFDENLIRTLGIKSMGDILLILKHAKFVFEKTKGTTLEVKSTNQIKRPPIVQ